MKSNFIRLNHAEIADMLAQWVKKIPLKEKAYSRTVFETLERQAVIGLARQWRAVAGIPLADHSLPHRLKQGCLLIVCDHGIFAQQILLLKNQLIDKINRSNLLLGKISDIKTKVGAVDFSILKQTGEQNSPQNSFKQSAKIQDIMSPLDKMAKQADDLRQKRFQDIIDGLQTEK